MNKIGLILPSDYKLLSVAAILDVFETVNRIYADERKEIPFDIFILRTPDQIEKEGNQFYGHSLTLLHSELQFDLVLMPSFTTLNMQETILKNHIFIPWIQQQFQQGAVIASFCTGTFLLGASGLLDGRVATTHMDASMRFAASFPKVLLKPNQVVAMDGKLYTSGGSTSTFHLLLRLVQKYCGNEMTIRIAKIFAIDLDRYNQSYFGTFLPSRNHKDELVKKVQDNIESRFHEIGTLKDIIRDIPSSRRNILRRFKLATGIPPIEYLQKVRIESAKKQLEQTNQNINEIIEQTGYSDPSSFRKVFNKLVGMTPLEYRDKFNIN